MYTFMTKTLKLLSKTGVSFTARSSKGKGSAGGEVGLMCMIIDMWAPISDIPCFKTLRLSSNLHIGVKAKTALTNLNRQGRLYSRLLQ